METCVQVFIVQLIWLLWWVSLQLVYFYINEFEAIIWGIMPL